MVDFQLQMLAGVTSARPVVRKEHSPPKNRKSTRRIDMTGQALMRLDEAVIGINCPRREIHAWYHKAGR